MCRLISIFAGSTCPKVLFLSLRSKCKCTFDAPSWPKLMCFYFSIQAKSGSSRVCSYTRRITDNSGGTLAAVYRHVATGCHCVDWYHLYNYSGMYILHATDPFIPSGLFYHNVLTDLFSVARDLVGFYYYYIL